jgi:DNA invertase Pin-like site-specific DNA recombinase
MFKIIGAMAEFARSLIVERVNAGMRNARFKGMRIGGPPRAHLTQEDRRAITEAYRRGQGSLGQLAVQFSTSVRIVQRCIRTP